eukprot:1108952-Ditylum_brightwellii.AAC.1
MVNFRHGGKSNDTKVTKEDISNEMLSALRICNLADSYFKSSEFESALDSYQVALGMMQSDVGKSHVCNSRPLKGMGVVLYHMGNDDKAFNFLSNAIDLLKKDGEKYSLHSVEIYDLIGDIHRRRGELPQAQKSYRKSIRIMQHLSASKNNSSSHELNQIMSRINHKRGLVHQERGHAKKAQKRFEQSHDILSEIGDDTIRRQFLMSNLPRLKAVTSSQASVEQCINQLNFFSEIPSICQRLQNELNTSRGLENRWQSVQLVCIEHVGLEILLNEALYGFQKKIDAEAQNNKNQRKSVRDVMLRMSILSAPTEQRERLIPNICEKVKTFLEPHATIVWNLGDQIANHILSATSSPLDFVLRDPAGMKLITEAVDAYDIAATQYKDICGESGSDIFMTQNLNFTDIRTDLVAQIYRDLEHRSSHAFTSMEVG